MEKKSSSSKFRSLKEFLSSTRSLNHQNNYETGLKKPQHGTSNNFRSSIRNTKNSISLFNLIAASGGGSGNDRLGGTSTGAYERPISMALDDQYGYAYEDREIAPRTLLPNKSVSMYGLNPVDTSSSAESHMHPSSSTRNLAARLFYNLRSKFRRRRRDRNKIVDSKSTEFGALFPEDDMSQSLASQTHSATDADLNAVKPSSARYQLKSANSLDAILDNFNSNNGAMNTSSRTENNYEVTVVEPSVAGTSSTASRSNNYANDLDLSLKMLADANNDSLHAFGMPANNSQFVPLPNNDNSRDNNIPPPPPHALVPVPSVSPKPAKCLTKELDDLLHYGWYWGGLSKEEAEAKLKDQPDGAFVVRDSSSDHYLLSLSFNSNGKTLHTRIEYRNGQFCFYMSQDSDSFNTVAELIEHCIAYSEVGIFCYSKPRRSHNASTSYPVRLTKPISRFTEVKSLLYLSRLVIRQKVRFDLIPLLPLPPTLIEFVSEQRYI